MRSKALPPARAQGHIVPFLEAAALFAALCIFARTAALMLAAAITAPLPMAETLFWLGRQSAQEQPASSVQVEAAPDSTPEAAASSLPQAVQALTGNIEDYLVPLLGEEARPADAGTVIEKNYPQGSGEKYIPCGAGSIKNNTRQTAADIAAEIENPLPFAIEPNSPDPQVLVMHTHATEDYRLSVQASRDSRPLAFRHASILGIRRSIDSKVAIELFLLSYSSRGSMYFTAPCSLLKRP